MFSFLRSIGLDPIEWNRAISFTDKGTPYIGEILDAAFEEAQAILVLLTGDDMARIGSRFMLANDPMYEINLTPQPRPNVLFEAGMAFGRDPDRTILVCAGEIRPFSDVAGRHVVRISNRAEHRQGLADRLRNAGCKVQTVNNVDWLSEGDFDAATRNPDDVRRDWVFNHPAEYSGPVWIKIAACDEFRSLEHTVIIDWGYWRYEGRLDLRASNTVTLLHSKSNDGLSIPIHFHISQPGFVVFGQGYPREPGLIDTGKEWKRIE